MITRRTTLQSAAGVSAARRKDAAPAAEQTARTGDSQSIERAVAILRAVAERPGSSLGQIAKDTGLARSTVQRLVASLNAQGLLAKTFGQQGVYLGMELARLGARVNLDARNLLMPLMAKLHEQIGDNIDLTTLDGSNVIVIEQIASNENIRVISYVGKQHPIHCTANGKAHLGALDREKAMQILRNPLPALTPHSITDRDTLLAQIDGFRKTGLYIDREEYGEGACAVAVNLPDINGRQLAISIAMPTSRFARRENDVKAALLQFRATVRNTFGRSI